MEELEEERCEICDLPRTSLVCKNPICTSAARCFEWNYAVAMRSGPLEEAINAYKYQDRKEWAQIFARVLVGFLDSLPDTFRQFDLITASPVFVGRGASSRTWDHTRRVLMLAYGFSEGCWPFDVGQPPAIIKLNATTPMQGKTWKDRDRIAVDELRPALQVPMPSRILKKRVLVYDDVFTSGHTLNEVARRLRLDGASAVCGVTLARQKFRGR